MEVKTVVHPIKISRLREIVVTLVAVFLACLQPANAISVKYDIVGSIKAPIKSGPVRIKSKFNMDILPGELLLTYDDGDTADVSDDIATIVGTTHGCIGYTANDCKKSLDNKGSQPFGIHKGAGEFAWDITMTEAIPGLTIGYDEFAFGMQINAGTLTLLNTTSKYKDQLGRPGDPSSDVTLKTDNTPFAFQIVPTDDGRLVGTGWLALMGGFLGKGGVRFEFGPNNQNINWAFSLIRHVGDGGPDDLPTDIPEPASVVLLAAGLYSLRARKKAEE